MIKAEQQRVTNELATAGYSLTSYAELGLTFDAELAAELCDVAAQGTFSPSAAELTAHIEKNNMTIVQEERALALGRQVVTPLVDGLFAGSPRALENWNLYGINHYNEAGAGLGAHQDSVGSTVLIASISGLRKFCVYRKEPEYETFREIESTFTLSPGSVVILDGYADPGHFVECLEGPSVSAVFDVPDLLRPEETYQINQQPS